MQGNCTSPPPISLNPERLAAIPTPEPWSTPRCVVIVSEEFMQSDSAHVWVDSLHIQFIHALMKPYEAEPLSRAFFFRWSAVLFLSNSVIQGDDTVNAAGISVIGSPRGMYCRGAPPCQPEVCSLHLPAWSSVHSWSPCLRFGSLSAPALLPSPSVLHMSAPVRRGAVADARFSLA